VSTKKIKKLKITKDGIHGGKNRQILDGEGKPMGVLDAMREEQRLKGN